MIILSYNPTDDKFFIGLSFDEFNRISELNDIVYYHRNFENEVKHSNLQLQNKGYIEMITDIFGIDEMPFICIIIDRAKINIETAVHHHPFHQLWNGYSPWIKIDPITIHDLNLDNITINIKE